MKDYRIKTKLACEFARVERQQFNEAVAGGLYRCAPPTTRGSTRIFSTDDVVALFIFGRLTRMGLGVREAAHMACSLHAVFSSEAARLQFDEKPIAAMVEGLDGSRTYLMTERATPEALGGIGSIICALSFDVPEIRKHINRLAELEAATLGADDE